MLTRRPPRELFLLMAVAILDLILTVTLYKFGLIEELNPLMRPLLEISPILFSLVKLATLAAAYAALQWYRKVDEQFVKSAAGYGALAYVVLWGIWTSIGNLAM